MLFTSIDFILFLPCVVIFYYLISPKFRWVLLLSASYFFYAYWEPAYLLLIIISTIVDYIAGLKMGGVEKKYRKKYLIISLAVNLGLLFFFKYYNFFVGSITPLCDLIGVKVDLPYSDFLLPVGISFYTFQTLSYSIDVYRGQEPEKHFGVFAVFVTFFPQLVAGPIERSKNLLPQFKKSVKFNSVNFEFAFYKILFGYFKKLVIADRLAIYVESIYSNPSGATSATLLLATVFFAFQIYCDFSAYSDIAIGSAELVGIKLMENFKRPYFATNLEDFWRRWHISLSTWFRDYVYFPLGGSRLSTYRTSFNILIVFLISGFWHGASWTFVIWGGFHGICLIFLKYYSSFKFTNPLPKAITKTFSIFFTFALVCISWVLFRANNMEDVWTIYSKFINFSFSLPLIEKNSLNGLFWILVLLAIDAKLEIGEGKAFRICNSFFIKSALYSIVIILIILFGVFDGSQFIYFQF